MIVFLTTADTEVLAAARARELLPEGFGPVHAANPLGTAVNLAGARAVLVRLLGGRRAWDGFDPLAARCRAEGIPLLAFSGEATADAELTAASTVPAGVLADAFEYLVQGGVANTAQLFRFVADTVLREGFGFDPPETLPDHGVHGERELRADRPTVGIVFYRTHWMSGNTAFLDELADAVEAAGANALPVFCYSLRPDPDGAVPAIDAHLRGKVDVLVTTVLAMGGRHAAGAETWPVPALEELDVPVVQAISATTSRALWQASDNGLAPLDAAMQVAIPEFDGRIISVPFSFKEEHDGIARYVTDAERAARVAGIAVRLARLRRRPECDKRVAIVLSNYPTKHARVGNAVGLDTPASAVRLLDALHAAGYDTGDWPTLSLDGDALVHRLIDAGGFDAEFLTEEQLAANPTRLAVERYQAWFCRLPADLQDAIVGAWGEPPGELYVHDSTLAFATLSFGNVVLAVQPPRGFGENPVAIYHDPDLAPTHHYLAFYRWLDEEWGADAVVHLGKHGTLEWMPGKGLGLSAACAPDALLADVPFFYPFVVNDPGEGTQAKRRAHATIVDHLVPPLTRAETYDELYRLEQLLDEYYQVQTMDPGKVAALQGEIWHLLRTAELTHDLKLAEHGDEVPPDLDDIIIDVDGYLCELKDLQIRGGLHILGQPPAGEERLGLILAILRLPQSWPQAPAGLADVPALRSAIARAWGLGDEPDHRDTG
ncbi:MAG: cobaltochelatase subunit CobN, partial [Egibacteraceae bacterium]